MLAASVFGAVNAEHAEMSEGFAIIEPMFDLDQTSARSLQVGEPRPSRSYADTMTVSAHDVAAAVRDRLPGLPKKKLHKLLYYCQGYHLAQFDEPLFAESISAWDMGPVVGQLWHAEKMGEQSRAIRRLNEAQLNTVGYVLSRYGGLSGRDLENLTHCEAPWQLADSRRRPGDSARIEMGWLRDYFKESSLADHEDDDLVLDSVAISAWLEGADERRLEPRNPDTLEQLKARLINGVG